MTRMLVNTKIRFQKAIEARGEDAGQGTLEYIGMVLVAVVLVVAVITAFDTAGIATKIGTSLTNFANKLPSVG
jgi:hypothetical protein